MSKLLLILSAMLFSTFSYADDINKLFNFELGSTINLSQENLISNNEAKSSATYAINFRDFDKVIVDYTPTSHRISTLFAQAPVTGVCSDERELIVGIFAKRFGEFKSTITSSRYLLRTIKSDDKILSVYCAMNGTTPVVVIGLVSGSMEDMAKKERIESDSKKDSSSF